MEATQPHFKWGVPLKPSNPDAISDPKGNFLYQVSDPGSEMGTKPLLAQLFADIVLFQFVQ